VDGLPARAYNRHAGTLPGMAKKCKTRSTRVARYSGVRRTEPREPALENPFSP
jgi:hypothetical protein